MDCSATCKSESICDDSSLNGMDDSKEAEGVWSQDIEQCFHEALNIYPPCGRRKIVLSEEGKMYGRNELIARYIKLRTGKTRSRKQVSSHIQVLARRKTKEYQSNISDPGARLHVRQSLSGLSSAQIVSDMRLPERFRISTNSNLMNNEQRIIDSIPHNNWNQPYPNNISVQRGPAIQQPLHIPIQYNKPQQVTSNSHSPTNSSPPSSATHLTPHPLLIPENLPNLFAAYQQNLPQYSSFNPSNPLWNNLIDSQIQKNFQLYLGRSIATKTIRLALLSVFIQQSEYTNEKVCIPTWKHTIAHLQSSLSNLSNSPLEMLDITQIWDKFPDNDGLKDFFETGPQNAFFLVKFWIDCNCSITPNMDQFSSIIFESSDNVPVKLSSKVCSFGREVLERIEDKSPISENGLYVYRFENMPMCEYMRKFMVKLADLKEDAWKNSVLENFTILVTVTNVTTNEILLCIAFAMEVATNETLAPSSKQPSINQPITSLNQNNASQYHIYKLTTNQQSSKISFNHNSTNNNSTANILQQLPPSNTTTTKSSNDNNNINNNNNNNINNNNNNNNKSSASCSSANSSSSMMQ